MRDRVRRAEADDLPLLTDIERAGDALFGAYGIVFPPGPCVIETVHEPGPVLVAGRPPVGFALTMRLDGQVHLEQLAVHPAHGRRGIGGRLLSAVCEQARSEGATVVTLTTFRDVPWNGPWYARHGFTELPGPQWGPELSALVEAERAHGLDVSRRLVMRRLLTPA